MEKTVELLVALAKKYAKSVKGIWITVIVSSLLFGLCHVSNLFFGEGIAAVCTLAALVFSAMLFSFILDRKAKMW